MKKLQIVNCRATRCGRQFFTIILLLVSYPVFGQSICFNSHNDFVFEGTSNANSMDVGDFDNDGINDIIQANFTAGAGKMVFIKGNSNGTFQPPVIFEGGTRPIDVKAFDFNLDGNLDVVVANNSVALISVVFGNGDGTFMTPVTYATGPGPSEIALGDFNEDGFIDLAIACLAVGYVNIYLMDSGNPGSFIASGTVVTGSGPRGIVAKDFNNDGHLDIATANNSAAGFGVVLGTGTGTFGTVTAYATQPGCFSIISADFNGDNLPDIATSNESSNSISVAINTGSGFSPSINYPVKSLPNGIKCGDFNNDGLLDIASVEYADNTFSVLEGTGLGTFLPAIHLTCIGSPRDLVIYDCNNDGNVDAIMATQVGQVLPVFLGLGNGSFQHRVSYPVGTNPQGISKGDFNNDGFQDIVVANTTGNTIQLLINDGSGEFTNGGTFATDLGPMSVDVKDVNGDGNMDVVTANNTSNTISVFLGNGTGGLTSVGSFSCNAQPKIVKIGDVNNDGFLDVVVLNATNNFNVLLGSGTGTFGTPTQYPGANNGTDLELGLLNADAYLDVVMTAGGNHKLVVSLNSGSGTFNPMVEFNPPLSHTNPKGLSLGDVNNDGNLDAVVAYYGSNNFGRYLGNGAGGFSPIIASFTGGDTGPMDVELADLNNDGNLDVIAICEVSTSSTGYAPVFIGNGSTFTFFKRFSTDMGPMRLTVADWNNDGLKDAAAVNNVSKSVSILRNTTAIITANGPLTFCEGAGTTLSVTPATTYLWSSSQTTPVITPVTSGSYTAQTWTGHSSWCTSTSNAVIADVSPSPTLTLSNDISICSGQSTTLTVSGADSYVWAGGLGTLASITVSPTSTQYYVVEGFGLNGCSRLDSILVTVVGAPDATFTTLNATYCQDAVSVTLVPGTVGGTFSGGGVTGSVFDPSSAPLGSNTITYFVDLGGGCSSTSSQTVSVSAAPISSFSGLALDYCASATDVTLTPTQTGGTFSGTGITGNQFSPSTVGGGTFTITYTITTGGCSNSSAISTTVNPIPNTAFTGLAANYCSTEAAVTLTPSVGGGTFSGTGVVGSTFDPSNATLGANTVTYSITNAFGCTGQTSAIANVSTQPDASFSGLVASYCISSTTPVTLTPTVAGGTFSGPGITGTSFIPSSANLGTNTITYDVSLGSCLATSSIQTIVYALPSANFTGLNGTYCTNDVPSNLVPGTAGGLFSGTGVIGNTFDPSIASLGSNTITYSITDVNGCSNSNSLSTNVVSGPSPNFTGLSANYCISDAAVVLTPTSGGGVFSGPGITGSSFSPATATIGLNTITYQVSGSGCTNTFALQTTIHDIPNANFTGLDATYCSADAVSTLVPTQVGGTFTGSGIVGSTFDPSMATLGGNVITYSISDAFGCSNLSTISTTVTESFDATFTGLSVDYCVSQTTPVNLVPVTSGGTFTGSGLSGSQFTPSDAVIGVNTINYEVVNGGCISNYSIQTTVHATPNANFTGLDATYCSADAVSTLVPTQVGGTFTGSGIVGSTFDPSMATLGSNVITYSISDAFGCSNLSTISTTVTESFDATFTGLSVDYCVSQTTPVNLVPVTSGGTFTGSGLSGSQFTPSDAVIGVNTINYEVVNGGCISNYSIQTTVHATPNANFTGLDATYCSADAVSTLVPTQVGGTFTGSGIVGSTFDPSMATLGGNVITYSISDAFGCSNLSTISTTVTESFDATFTGLSVDYCVSQTTPVNLVPVTSGGTFTGSGLSGSQFTPSDAVIGVNTINYEVVNGGCISNYSIQTTVHATPNANFTGLDATYCSADAVSTLVPNVTGGSFSGGGVVGFNFQPNTAALGTNFIVYTLIDVFGCSGISTQSTVVTESLDPSFSGLLLEYCSTETSPITLVPAILGGVFTGNGVSGMQFTPSDAMIGTNTINYQLVNAGCTSNASFVTTIHSVPDASFTGLTTNYCNANQDFVLTPAVSGGTFVGPGMTGNTFNPYFAGTGTFVITHTVDDLSGCSGVSSQNITVYSSPNASFTGLDAHYCINDVAVILIPAETGGVFSGPGVVGNQFSPATASIGLFNVTYDISNANCTSTYTFATTVHDLPTVTYTGLSATYCSSDVGSTLVPNPTGGVFSGAGVTGNQFSPSGLLGNYSIEYEYTDVFGCSAMALHSTEVISTDDPFFTGIEALHCSSDEMVTMVPTTVGGIFTGNGVVGSTFHPGLAPVGVNNIQYQVGSGACIGTYQFSTVVLAAPSVLVNTNSNSLSVSLEFGTSYQWINCADFQPIIGATNFNFVPPFEGSFAVIASNSNCTDTSLCTNFFLDLKDVTSIVMSYYPNPSSGNLTIELEEVGELEIIDMSGRVLAKEHLVNGKNNFELSYVSRGMYQLNITTEQGLRGSYPFVKN